MNPDNFITFDNVIHLFQNGNVINHELGTYPADIFGNITIIILNKNKNNLQYYSIVQYDRKTNSIYPPLNSITPPTVIAIFAG